MAQTKQSHLCWCSWRDLNSQGLATTSFLDWHVCQFHHMSILAERDGFEPSEQKQLFGGLANRCTRPAMRPLHMAVRVGFEPTDVLPSLVFKTSSLSHSDTSPYWQGWKDSNLQRAVLETAVLPN